MNLRKGKSNDLKKIYKFTKIPHSPHKIIQENTEIKVNYYAGNHPQISSNRCPLS